MAYEVLTVLRLLVDGFTGLCFRQVEGLTWLRFMAFWSWFQVCGLEAYVTGSRLKQVLGFVFG